MASSAALERLTSPPELQGGSSTAASVKGAGGLTPQAGKFTRKPPSETEQARRKAWGKQWGQVGHQWKTEREGETS